MAEYKIVSMGPLPSRDLKRAGKLDTILTVIETTANKAMVVIIPSEKPTDKEIQDAIAAEHARQAAMFAKTYRV